jgi:hypothetical protein
MERMSTLDAGFFFVEHKNVPMHLGSLMVFEGPARVLPVRRAAPPAGAKRRAAGPPGARSRPATASARAVRPARAAGSGGAHGS